MQFPKWNNVIFSRENDLNLQYCNSEENYQRKLCNLANSAGLGFKRVSHKMNARVIGAVFKLEIPWRVWIHSFCRWEIISEILFIYFYQRRKMPRRKKTKKNTTSRVRPMLPEGDLETSMTIDERRAKLDVYIEDFNMQGRFYLDFYFFSNLNIMTWVLIFRKRTLKLGILEKPRINRSCFRSACLRSVLRDLSGTLGT